MKKQKRTWLVEPTPHKSAGAYRLMIIKGNKMKLCFYCDDVRVALNFVSSEEKGTIAWTADEFGWWRGSLMEETF